MNKKAVVTKNNVEVQALPRRYEYIKTFWRHPKGKLGCWGSANWNSDMTCEDEQQIRAKLCKVLMNWAMAERHTRSEHTQAQLALPPAQTAFPYTSALPFTPPHHRNSLLLQHLFLFSSFLLYSIAQETGMERELFFHYLCFLNYHQAELATLLKPLSEMQRHAGHSQGPR